jgi:ZIP family zinc transporter
MLQAILFGLATFASTFIGGQIALKYRNFIKPLIAFCGGTLVAAALLDLIPESIEMLEMYDSLIVMGIVLASFIGFHLLDKLISIHGHTHSEECEEEHHHRNAFGGLAAFGLILHTFLDGLVIGTGFLVDSATGILLASIVLIHDFADGMNTVTLLLRNNQDKKTVWFFLLLAAITPLFGVFAANLLHLSTEVLGIILAIFAGFFLYLGATDLLPEAHRERSSAKLVLFTILGAVVVVTFRLLVE